MKKRFYLALWVACGLFWLAIVLLNTFTNPYMTSGWYRHVLSGIDSFNSLLFVPILLLTIIMTIVFLWRLIMFLPLSKRETWITLGALGMFIYNVSQWGTS